MENYRPVVEQAIKPMAVALGLPEEVISEASFSLLMAYGDVIQCNRMSKGDEMDWIFTDETEHAMHMIPITMILESLDDQARALFCTKLI